MAYVLGDSGEVEESGDSTPSTLRGSFQKDGGAVMSLGYRGAQYTRKIPKNGLVTHSEAGALLRVARESIWRWVQAGKLRGWKVRGVNVVSIAELKEFGIQNGYLVRAK